MEVGVARELFGAIHDAYHGGAPMPAEVAVRVVRFFRERRQRAEGCPELGRLTPRETEILELLACGHLYKEIAESLRISPQTVNGHIKSIYENVYMHSRGQAVAEAGRLARRAWLDDRGQLQAGLPPRETPLAVA